MIGTSNGSALEVAINDPVSGSNVTVSDLTFSNPGYSAVSNTKVACVYALNSANNMVFERLQFKQCHSSTTNHASGVFLNSGGTFTLRNISVIDGQAPENGGLAINAGSYGGLVSNNYLSHISITDTTSTVSSSTFSGLYILVVSPLSNVYLSNSVIWGNDPDPGTSDLYISAPPTVYFSRVHYGKLLGAPAVNNAPGTGDPGFQAANDPQPSGSSVLIDSGYANVPGGAGTLDIDGKPRGNGVAPDVGAYEVDYLFRANFE